MQTTGLRFGAVFEVKSRPVQNRGEEVSRQEMAEAREEVEAALQALKQKGGQSVPVGHSAISKVNGAPDPDSTVETSYAALVGTTEEDAALVSNFARLQASYTAKAMLGKPADRSELTQVEARLRSKQAGDVSYTSDKVLAALNDDRFDLAAGRITSGAE